MENYPLITRRGRDQRVCTDSRIAFLGRASSLFSSSWPLSSDLLCPRNFPIVAASQNPNTPVLQDSRLNSRQEGGGTLARRLDTSVKVNLLYTLALQVAPCIPEFLTIWLSKLQSSGRGHHHVGDCKLRPRSMSTFTRSSTQAEVNASGIGGCNAQASSDAVRFAKSFLLLHCSVPVAFGMPSSRVQLFA